MLLSNVLLDMDLASADTLVASVEVEGDHPLLLEYDPNNGKVNVLSRDSNIINHTTAPWGCMPEITEGCVDMTNASSTWIGIVVGGIVGAFITWVVYFLQKKTTIKQDQSLDRLEELDKRHDAILKLMQHFQEHQEKLLEQILGLEKKIDSNIERKKSSL
jgi:hypothetical protein